VRTGKITVKKTILPSTEVFWTGLNVYVIPSTGVSMVAKL
jgi:hypothetical protein